MRRDARRAHRVDRNGQPPPPVRNCTLARRGHAYVYDFGAVRAVRASQRYSLSCYVCTHHEGDR